MTFIFEITFSLALGLGLGLFGWHKTKHVAWLRFGISLGVLGALLVVLLSMMISTYRMRYRGTSSPRPPISWREDRRFGLLTGLAVGAGIALVICAAGSLHSRERFAATLGDALSTGLLIGVIAAFTVPRAWPSSLAAIQIGMGWHAAVHLMGFLDDAHKRNILRSVGPVYQFRHARIQDRLAAGADTAGTAQPRKAENTPFLDST